MNRSQVNEEKESRKNEVWESRGRKGNYRRGSMINREKLWKGK